MIERADISQYNSTLDAKTFQTFMDPTVPITEQFSQELSHVRKQLRSDLGERLDLSKSAWFYEIVDGKLYDPVRNIPMEKVVRDGLWRNPIDEERDRAELATFVDFVQGYLASQDTPDGTTLLSVSPPGKTGSFETKNFFRVFVKKDRSIYAFSYFSDLKNSEYRQKILSINPAYAEQIPENPTDIDLKSTPLIIPEYLEFAGHPDKLAEFILDGRQVGMPEEEFQDTWEDLTPLVTSYLNTLVDNPWALAEIEEGYQAFLGGAHISIQYRNDNIIPEKSIFRIDEEKGIYFSGSRMEIKILADESYHVGGGACGAGGCSTGKESISSVLSFSPDGKGPLEFPCPSCGKINKRPIFGYVYRCQNENCDDPEAVLPPEMRMRGLTNIQ